MRTRLFAGITVAALAVTGLAQAYAPPGAFILGLVATRRQKQKLDALRLTVKRVEMENGAPKGEPVEVVTTYRGAGRVRHEWTDVEGKHVRLTDGVKAWRADGDKKGPASPELHVMDALWATSGDAGEKDAADVRAQAAFKSWNVVDNLVTLARTDGRIAWVLGAEPNKVDVAQVWVDKDDFLPLRFIHPEGPVVEGQPVVLVDERLKGWASPLGGEFWPARVETWKGGVLVRVEELVKVDVTPKIDERDFKLE